MITKSESVHILRFFPNLSYLCIYTYESLYSKTTLKILESFLRESSIKASLEFQPKVCPDPSGIHIAILILIQAMDFREGA